MKKIFWQYKKIAIGFVSLLIVAVFIWWIFFNSQTKKPQYQTTQVKRGAIVSSVTASGQILTANVINVTTQVSGIVKQVFVSEGDKVVLGQKIAEISLDAQGAQKNASAWSNYLSAKNSLESAKATAYSLQSDMFAKWKAFYNLATSSTYQNSDGTPNETNRALPEFLISQKDWLAAEAKYKNQEGVITQAQAALNSAWLSYQLSSPTIVTPTDGIITNLMVAPGMSINSEQNNSSTTPLSQQVAVIKNNELKPLASFNLSENDVTKVKTNQKATIIIDSLSGKTFTGKVISVNRIGTVTSGVTNYPAIIQLDTNSPDILPNMAATANIILETKDNVLLVPSAAVQTRAGQSFVRVLKKNKIQEVVVETGLTSDTQTEIVSGLSEGDEVIISIIETTQSRGSSPFGSRSFGTFGGGALRPGGFR